ncbi:hypothetical protein T492DRAFT_933517 [Pavlovales sp. CCMP2436]|nr:hypothetical protein T492DRAFT_933517 [Pavlovales sp. CCMP2436]
MAQVSAMLGVLGYQSSFFAAGCAIGSAFPRLDPTPLARFTFYAALPALLFRSMLALDLSALDVAFLSAVLLAKWLVALGGMALGQLLLTGPRVRTLITNSREHGPPATHTGLWVTYSVWMLAN